MILPPITVNDGSELYPPRPRQSKRCPRRKRFEMFGLLAVLWVMVSAPQVVVTSDGRNDYGQQKASDARGPVVLWSPIIGVWVL